MCTYHLESVFSFSCHRITKKTPTRPRIYARRESGIGNREYIFVQFRTAAHALILCRVHSADSTHHSPRIPNAMLMRMNILKIRVLKPRRDGQRQKHMTQKRRFDHYNIIVLFHSCLVITRLDFQFQAQRPAFEFEFRIPTSNKSRALKFFAIVPKKFVVKLIFLLE